MTPHWVISEHNDVAFPDRYVNNGCLASQFRSTGKLATDQQILFVRIESENDARSGAGCVSAAAKPTGSIIAGRVAPCLSLRRAALWHSRNRIRIIDAASARWAISITAARSP